MRWAGTIGSVAPSIAHQVVLDLMPHDDATFTMEPPGYPPASVAAGGRA